MYPYSYRAGWMRRRLKCKSIYLLFSLKKYDLVVIEKSLYHCIIFCMYLCIALTKPVEKAAVFFWERSVEFRLANMHWPFTLAYERGHPQGHQVHESLAHRQLQNSQTWRHVRVESIGPSQLYQDKENHWYASQSLTRSCQIRGLRLKKWYLGHGCRPILNELLRTSLLRAEHNGAI